MACFIILSDLMSCYSLVICKFFSPLSLDFLIRGFSGGATAPLPGAPESLSVGDEAFAGKKKG